MSGPCLMLRYNHVTTVMERVAMRRITGLLVLVALLWGGYWFAGSRAVKTAVSQAVEADPRITAADIRVAGFPNRFDTTFSEPRWSDAGVSWSAPFFQSFALSYKPTHLVFVWPQTQSVTLPAGTIDIAQEDLRASVVFEGLTALRLDRTSLVGDALTLSDPSGQTTRIATLRAATRATDDTGQRHQAALDLSGVTLPQTLVEAVFRANAPAAVVGQARIDTTLGFDAPLDRASFEVAPPVLTDIALTQAEIAWGPLALSAEGQVDVDTQGRPEGRLSITFDNWREWFDVLESLGVIPLETRDTWQRAAELLATTSGSPDTLTAPLTFRNGFVSFGPLPLGPAPRLR